MKQSLNPATSCPFPCELWNQRTCTVNSFQNNHMPLLHSISTPYFGTFFNFLSGGQPNMTLNVSAFKQRINSPPLTSFFGKMPRHFWCSFAVLCKRSWHHNVSQKRTTVTLKNTRSQISKVQVGGQFVTHAYIADIPQESFHIGRRLGWAWVFILVPWGTSTQTIGFTLTLFVR